MKTYISLLRGINVSGQNKIRMVDLKKTVESIGYHSVETYLQSGNVIFDSQVSDRQEIASLIEMHLRSDFGFQVPVFIREAIDFRRIIQENPFIQRQEVDPGKLYVTFLSETTTPKSAHDLGIPGGINDEFLIDGTEIFLYLPDGYGHTILNNNFFEKKLELVATTRNWKTVNTLFTLASSRIA